MGTATLERIALGNGWSFDVACEEIHLDDVAVGRAVDILTRWTHAFTPSETWVAQTYGVPSLFVRIDGIYCDGEWSVMEIEDRPCGLGAVGLINPAFKDALEGIRATWPDIHFVHSPTRVTDDHLWLGQPRPLEESMLRSDYVLVRARPDESEYHPLRTRSVSTVSEEGNKLALVDMGLASVVEWCESLGTPPHDGYITPPIPHGPHVFKPVQGTRGRDVIFHAVDLSQNHANSKRRGDTRGTEGIERVVKRYGRMLMQPLYRPLSFQHLPGLNGIYRLYFGFDTRTHRYVPLHGAYVASRSLKVHGDEDTIFGPLVVS
jgi:hypothetical protein